jgi:hypothetical protein
VDQPLYTVAGFFETLKYETLAAKRYRKYRWQERKESFAKSMAAIILQLLQAIIKILQQAGLTKRRTVEKVSVE